MELSRSVRASRSFGRPTLTSGPQRLPWSKCRAGEAGKFVRFDDAVVTSPNIAATNGVVHVVDRVLRPPR